MSLADRGMWRLCRAVFAMAQAHNRAMEIQTDVEQVVYWSPGAERRKSVYQNRAAQAAAIQGKRFDAQAFDTNYEKELSES